MAALKLKSCRYLPILHGRAGAVGAERQGRDAAEGGNASLTEAQVRAAVEFMISQSK
jgi:cytochrome c5